MSFLSSLLRLYVDPAYLAQQAASGFGPYIKLVDAETNEKDPALISIMDDVRVATFRMGMFQVEYNAQWAAAQMLKKVGYPLSAVSFIANRRVFKYEIGDVVRIIFTPYSLDKVFRIVEIEEQAPDDETIKISAIQDINYLGEELPLIDLPDEDLPIIEQLSAIEFYAFEAPYNVSPDQYAIIVIAARNTGTELGYRPYMDLNNAGFMGQPPQRTFGVIGTLDEAYPDNTLTIDPIGFTVTFPSDTDLSSILESLEWREIFGTTNLALLYNPSAGTYEIITFQNTTPITATQWQIDNVFRSRYGSEKIDETVTGIKFIFLGRNFATLNSTGFSLGTQVGVKAIPFDGRAILDEAQVGSRIVVLNGLHLTPYSPVNLACNGDAAFPKYTWGEDLVITWNGRIRGGGCGFSSPEGSAPATPEGYFRILLGYGTDSLADAIEDETYTIPYSVYGPIFGWTAQMIRVRVQNYVFTNNTAFFSEEVYIDIYPED